MDPHEALKGRTCSVHRRLLEVREVQYLSKHCSSVYEMLCLFSGGVPQGSLGGPPPLYIQMNKKRQTFADMSIQE